MPDQAIQNPEIFTSPWLTTAQAARYLHMSGGTLANWRISGEGPNYQAVGRVIRYHKDELDAFMFAGAP